MEKAELEQVGNGDAIAQQADRTTFSQNGVSVPAAPPQTDEAIAQASQLSTLDCDSDELEALEDEADTESTDEAEIDRIVDEAAITYPHERIDELVVELKKDGLILFMQTHVDGISEKRMKAFLIALGVLLPKQLREADQVPLPYLTALLKSALIRVLRRREKLKQYNTVDDAVELIKKSKRIMVLGGAGLSTSCGIPDFRSKDGIYAQLQHGDAQYAQALSDPTDMFNKEFFLYDPTCFFSFAKQIFPSNFKPSPSHRFIKLLEDKQKLLRHYTQNIDTLEDAAGIEKVLHCHGSFSKAACTTPGCTFTVPGSYIKEDIFAQRVPKCPKCSEAEEAKKQAKSGKSQKNWKADDNDDDDDDELDALPGIGVLKPCITFFGEALSGEFDQCVVQDREKVDLLIVMGTSLRVAPVSELVGHIPHSTPVILINRTPVTHLAMDIQLLGNGDEIVDYLCKRLDWQLPLPKPSKEVVGQDSAAIDMAVKEETPAPGEATKEGGEVQPQRLGDTHIWLFPGAEADELKEMWAAEEEEEEEDGDDQPNLKRSADSPHEEAPQKIAKIDE
ncbi:DHS-like NAD/FAD-binding domain-containing protein [Meira miltonrushii]|uniref:DHS-like NAD/FAD-binding domain-containing protein n=1 Tax=Meira miltonrushii TaxID=1280837 RepID=A0A316V662_9BASI|nr:DHS-like NAD/FAD-binding domain-containing protein [Meira miltonrushii]PWN33067.1 DHS-like NAD/FAD-binding domain-containing protein [Meira miltonrushii]